MLALILATKKDTPPGFSKGTLIGTYWLFPKINYIINFHVSVSPLSVLSNWEKQIEDHCTTGSLSVCMYYGTNRSMGAEALRKFDVVITTYQTVATEHFDNSSGAPSKKKKKVERTLFDVEWKVNFQWNLATRHLHLTCYGLANHSWWGPHNSQLKNKDGESSVCSERATTLGINGYTYCKPFDLLKRWKKSNIDLKINSPRVCLLNPQCSHHSFNAIFRTLDLS